MADAQGGDSTDWSDQGAFLVLGGSGGIGREVARRLLDRGATTVLACRNVDRITALELPGDPFAVACDATDPGQVQACMEQAIAHAGKIAGVAHCVGSLLLKPAHLTSDDEWAEVLAANLTSAFHVVRAAVKAMRSGGGSVVLCSSAAASAGLPNHEGIAAAKAGVEGLARSAAATYAGRGLRFNAVAPGLVRTPLTATITENERALEASRAMHPLGRIGEPEDVAAAIYWLLDPANTWTSGQVIGVDGGLATLRGVPRR